MSILQGVPPLEALNNGEVGKTKQAVLKLCVNISKTVRDTSKVKAATHTSELVGN